jgi:cytidylate kinase
MTEHSPSVITISRQFGSGGAYLGHRIADRLNIAYVDHEILHEAAQELKVPETILESRDEKVTPLWESLLQSYKYANPFTYVPPTLDFPNDDALYNTESAIIKRIAKEYSAVIVGRGGYYVLRQHTRCLHIYLHANIEFRQQRIQEMYRLSALKALKLIESTDNARAHYLHVLTGQDCLDVRQYQLALDTSAVGIDKAEDIILATIQARFGVMSRSTQKVS